MHARGAHRFEGLLAPSSLLGMCLGFSLGGLGVKVQGIRVGGLRV